jgi:tRNA1(Val) A37 N6-methylase TrmN6
LTELTTGTLLGGRVAYRQFAAGHRSGFEPVFLAAAVPARPGALVLEAGTGAGAALLCLGRRVPGVVAVGVELDPGLAALASENFKINGLHDIFSVRADAARLPFGQKFDHVMANPPWHDGAGTASPDGGRALAHRAGPGLLAGWVAELARVLRPGGSLTLIVSAACHGAAARALADQGLGAITLFPFWPRAGMPAKFLVLQARRAGAGRVLAGLVLHDEGGMTAAAESVLREMASLPL